MLRIIFVEQVIGILMLIQKGQRERTLPVREAVDISRGDMILFHKRLNHVPHVVIAYFADKKDLLPQTPQRDQSIEHGTSRDSRIRLVSFEYNIQNGLANAYYLSHTPIYAYSFLLCSRLFEPK